VRTLLSSFSLKLLGQESLLSARRPEKKNLSLPPYLPPTAGNSPSKLLSAMPVNSMTGQLMKVLIPEAV
jgi:hypothetical protein